MALFALGSEPRGLVPDYFAEPYRAFPLRGGWCSLVEDPIWDRFCDLSWRQWTLVSGVDRVTADCDFRAAAGLQLLHLVLLACHGGVAC